MEVLAGEEGSQPRECSEKRNLDGIRLHLEERANLPSGEIGAVAESD